LNQEDIHHLNRSATNNEIEAVIKSLPIKKNPGPNRANTEFSQNFEEELTPMLLNLFLKIEKEGMLPISLHDGSITLITNTRHKNNKKFPDQFP
jgi:hypothetical protein